MAEFEGNLNLNVETSEIEIKGKFKLTEGELDTVAGGANFYQTKFTCKSCDTYFEISSGQKAYCPNCNTLKDERTDVDEALADVDALMADVDGFDF